MEGKGSMSSSDLLVTIIETHQKSQHILTINNAHENCVPHCSYKQKQDEKPTILPKLTLIW